MGSVTIERRRAIWRDRFRSYVVTIDDKKVGTLRSGETKSFPLVAGPHVIRATIDWCGSPSVTVDGADDTRLVCQCNGSAFSASHDIARPDNYIALAKAD